MEKTKEDVEFEYLVEEKRHKEITQVLSKIATLLSEEDNREIISIVAKQSDNINILINSIQKASSISLNNSTVELKKFVSLIEEISNNIIESNEKVITTLENRLLPDTFDLIKSMGVTQVVERVGTLI